MAAALLSRRLGVLGVPAFISSAGLVDEGHPASPGAVAAMAVMGMDISDHRSRRLEARMLAEADLVLAMAAEHVRECAVLDASAWARAFTLKELVRRGAESGRRRPGEELVSWLGRLHEGREVLDLLGSPSDNDIADPIGMSDRAYRATARELDRLLAQLVDLAWAASPAGSTSSYALAQHPHATARHPGAP